MYGEIDFLTTEAEKKYYNVLLVYGEGNSINRSTNKHSLNYSKYTNSPLKIYINKSRFTFRLNYF